MKETEMKSKFKIHGIYMIAYLLLLPTLVTLGAIACINHLGDDGYFTTETIANVGAVGLAAASIFLLTYIIWARKSIDLIPSFTSPLNYGPCAVMAAALVFISAHLILKAGVLGGELDVFTLVTGVLALLSVIYFTISAISVKRRSIMRSDLGIIVLVFLCAYIAYIFFDNGTPINAPIKTATMMAFLFFSLFFLYETRLSLGREKWHFYVAFAFISSLISAYASIPALIMYATTGKAVGISIYETVLVFAFFVFSTFKLFLVGELVPEKGSNVVNKLIASATARINELAPEEPEAEEIEELDENQFSILGSEEGESDTLGTSSYEADEAELKTSQDAQNTDEPAVSEENGNFGILDNENSSEDATRVTEIDEKVEESLVKAAEKAVTDETAENADEATESESVPEGEQNVENSSENDTRVTFSDKKDNE